VNRLRHAIFVFVFGPLLAAAQQPAVLRIDTVNHQITFHIGERIPLALSFTGPNDKSYGINMAGYDRSGRLNIDHFAVTPVTGTSDPLAAYFSSGGFMGGGITGFDRLSSKPIVITANLNEWHRFDQPGTYKLTVISNRVGHSNSPHAEFFANPPTPLTSNTLELKIIPATPEWQRSTLDRILSDLATPRRSSDPESLLHRNAAADLRYLATSDALAALASNLRDDRRDLGNDSYFGLIGSPPALRDSTIASMRHLLEDPDFPVSTNFLNALAYLQLGDAPTPTTSEAFTTRFALEQSYLKAAGQLALASLPNKQGQARALTAQTLASLPPEELSPTSPQISAILGSSFTQLPIDKQTDALLNNWDTLRSADMLPELQSLVRQAVPLTPDIRRLKSIALERWYDLDPEGAKNEALQQIGSAKPAFNSEDVKFVTTPSLPQFESVWANALTAHDPGVDPAIPGSLLVRFGTGAASAQIAGFLAQKIGLWACAPQGSALAYLVRFDPARAAPLLTQALAARGKTGCYQNLFASISRYTHAPVLNQAAIEALNDPKMEVLRDAIRYLIPYGDISARKPLLDRYLQWIATQPQSDQPQEPATDVADQQYLGHLLGQSLLTNQGWIPDDALIATVLAHCGPPGNCQQLKFFASKSTVVHASRVNRSERYSIGAFDLRTLELFEAKIDQFPKDTTFAFQHSRTPSQAEQDAFEATLPALFAKHGMKLIETK
jgi:hypothetical protein